MENKKVSVIIPVYNSQRTIKKCIDSVLNQTYNNIEIIIVNDGSSDDSYSICKNYSATHNNIKLLNCKNSGVSKSRNRGLNVAEGDYIQFLDSDDYLYKNTIADKITKMNGQNVELVITDYEFIYPNGKKEKNPVFLNNELMSIKEYMHKFSERPTTLFFGVLWNKMFKRSIIEKNKIRFDESTSFAEDFKFVLEYLKYVNNVAYINRCEYGYFYDESTDSLSKNKKLYNTLWDERKNLYILYKKVFEYKSIFSNNIQDYILEGMGGVIESYIKCFGYRQTIHKIKSICTEEPISELKFNYTGSRKTFRILILSIKYKMYFVIYFMYWLHIKLNIKG